MRARVLHTWEHLSGTPAPEALTAALTTALQLRARLDEHHPWALHPARTALILLDDCGEVDPALIALSVGVDSVVEEWHDDAGPASVVPVPAREGECLLEVLLAAPRRIRLAACAEHLDHARHLHMVPIPDPAAFRARVESTYLPIAARTDARLTRRFERWLEAARRREARSRP
jgi:hypothetical protein